MAYPNLAAEMVRNGVTEKDLAETVGKTTDTVKNWMKGKGDFPVRNAIQIRERFFKGLDLGYLFSQTPATQIKKEA